MHRLPSFHRILLLTEGRLGVFSSKTAASLLRFRARDVVAVVDSAATGADLRVIIPFAPSRPILPSIASAGSLHPDALFVGIAPVGGQLPDAMRRHVLDALNVGIPVISGLHSRLRDDAELTAAAARSGARMIELRDPPAQQTIAAARARATRCYRVLTVGTDCNVGKMVAALELTAAMQRARIDARFVATGQTGIMISGWGVAVDAVVSDFAAGAAEELVLHVADADVCIIEGQGSLAHPGYSGVTFSLLHGTCPDALVLVHHVGRTIHKAEPGWPIPPIQMLRAAYEQAAALLHPAAVVAVALNAVDAADANYEAERRRIESALGVPAADLLREGPDRILAAVEQARRAGGRT